MTELEAKQLQWTERQIRRDWIRITALLFGMIFGGMGAGAAVLALILRLTGQI
jgi:hypothetical protein